MKKLLIFICFFFVFSPSFSAENIGSNTGYKIPRFVSLKSDDVNLRIGSSINYPIILKYIIKNLPVEVTNEYDVWRKINDIEGNEGWIHKSLLKGDRYAIINPSYEEPAQILSKPKGRMIGKIGTSNIVKLNICLTSWCYINYKKNKGWILKKNLWGVYNDELINVPFYQPIINQLWKINF